MAATEKEIRRFCFENQNTIWVQPKGTNVKKPFADIHPPDQERIIRLWARAGVMPKRHGGLTAAVNIVDLEGFEEAGGGAAA